MSFGYGFSLPNWQTLSGPTGFTVLPAAGAPTYTVTLTVLDSAGTSYTVSSTVLDSAGTSYTPI